MFTNIPVPKPDKDNPYSPPGPRPTSLGLENNGGPVAFEYFQGMNLGTTRAGIDNKEMWWCDGWMPVAPRQLRTLPGVGPLLWTTPATTQIVFFAFANINALPLMIAVISDGSIYQVRTDTGVETQIAPAGTIQNPSRETVDISQWGADFVIVVAVQTNGYFLWDGFLFHGAGSLSPPITFDYNGSGYTSNPNVTVFGGSGSGASITAYVAPGSGIVTDGSIVAIGSGYLANDVVGLAFSGGGPTAKTAILTPVISSGSITSVVLTDPGAGYHQEGAGHQVGARASVYGGGGSGASVSVAVTSGTISGVSIVDRGAGYLTQPTIIVTDVNNVVARATVGLMPYAIQGNAVETYAGHVWVANGPTIFYSAPGSPQDFSTNFGGGNFTSTDSFLRIGFTHLIQTNGFLYMFGDSSINYISGVQTAGTPPTTTFSNQNVDPEIGTPYSGSVLASSRAVLFANSFGVHSLSGSSVTKISGDLDGIWNSLANFGGFELSAAKALIYGKRVWMVLSKIVDPLSGSIVNKLFMYHNKQWWASGQDIDLTYIASQEINSVLTAWGTDGTSVYPLFQEGSADFTKVVQTKLYDQPGGYPWTKASARFWSIFYFEGDDAVTVEVDAENQTFGNINTYTFTSPTPTIEVQNASLIVIPVVDQSSVTITVESITSGYFITEPTAIGQQGELIGLTIRTDEPDLTLPYVFANVSVLRTPEMDAVYNAISNLGCIPCTATGTNTIALTQVAGISATVTAYSSLAPTFAFIAAASASGAITIDINGIGAKNLYKNSGSTLAGTGDIVSGGLYLISYNAALDAAAGGFVLNNPSTSVSAPTVQRLTAGSGTYAATSGTVRQRVRMVGAGGGGGALATNAGSAGSADTSFQVNGTGTAWTAVKGNGGAASAGSSGGGGFGGVDGTGATLVVRMAGGSGGTGGQSATAGVAHPGGFGGSTPFAVGPDTILGTPAAVPVNSGAGGGGAGGNSGTNSGSGGGGGEYVELWVTGMTSAVYTVGTGGAGGTAGTTAGRAGADGYIIIEEFYI